MKRRSVVFSLIALLAGAAAATADSWRMVTGALLGAAAGWAVGRASDHVRTAVAVPVFTATGGLMGHYLDEQHEARREKAKTSAAVPSVPTPLHHPGVDLIKVSILNRNGVRTDVPVLRVGNRFVGPRGEEYPELPRSEDLAHIYGM